MRRIISLLLTFALLVSTCTGLVVSAGAAGGDPITAKVQESYTQSAEAQDITVRIENPGVTEAYCTYTIDGIQLPEGWILKSYTTSNDAQAIKASDFNAENGKLTYEESDAEDKFPANLYYEAVIAVPANISGAFTVTFEGVGAYKEYGGTELAYMDEVTAEVSIAKTPIKAVTVTGVTAPARGVAADKDITVSTGANGSIKWYEGTKEVSTFAASTAYTAEIIVKATSGESFASDVAFTVDGETWAAEKQADGSYKLTKTFPKTADKEVPAYTAPTDLKATYGDTLAKVSLPAGWAWNAPTTSVGNAGTNKFVAVYTPADTVNYKPVEVELSVAVAPKNVTVTVDAIAAQTYTGKQIEPAVKVNGTTEYVVAYTNNVNAGTAKVTVSAKEGSNYTFTAVTKTFEIKPAAITITAKNQSSLVNNPAPTLAGQYTVSGLLGSDKLVKEPTVAYEKTPNTTVAGTYKINVSGAEASDNYTITYVPGTLTISNKQVQTLTVTTPVDVTFGDNSKTLSATSNVSGASIKFAVKAGAEDVLAVTADGKLTPKKVGTAKILVTAEETATYGAAEAEIVVNVVPKQITAPAADTTKFVYTGEAQTYGIAATADYTVTGATQTAAGTYKVTVALKDKTNTTWADGKTADLTFDFVIEKAAITVPTAPTATYTYTGEAQTYGIKTDAAYTVTGATQTNAGSYTVTVALKDKTNTTWADGKTADLTYTFVIAKAAITITADDKAILIDEEVPAPTYTVSGLCGTEKLTKEPTVAYEGEVDNTAEGTYAIVVSGAEASDNYTITYVNGTLTISEEEEDENGSVPNPPAHDCAIVKFLDCDPYLWYHEGIDYVVNNGLMNGVSTGKFAPNANTTRAMIVTILWRLEGEPAAADASFTDVADGQWYSEAIDWASANGIVNGYSASKFGPMDSITREQMAAILYRYADMKGYDMQAGAALNFADAGSVSSYATAAMQWAVAEGLINGVGDNTLNPQGTATRAQVATILMRFCENVAK